MALQKHYLYKVSSSVGDYLGLLPNVISEFTYSQDINTAGTSVNIECGVSADTSRLPLDVYTDESGTPYTDESGTNNYTVEGTLPIVVNGSSPFSALIKNGNAIEIVEVSSYYPNGKTMFKGHIEHWEASFGGDGGKDSISIVAYSDGEDLDNYLVYAPSFTLDQQQSTDKSGHGNLSGFLIGQTFTTGSGVTNIGAITLNMSAPNNDSPVVLLQLFTAVNGTLLGSTQATITSSTAADYQLLFPSNIPVSPNTQYFFYVSLKSGSEISVYLSNSKIYSGGTEYVYFTSGWTAASSQDMYFKTYSGTTSTTGTYTSKDPTTGMLEPVLNTYISQGGAIKYTSGTIDTTELSLTYTFNTNTIYEAIKAVLTMCPSGFYYYVDLGTDTLYVKQTSSSPDYYLTKGLHINDITITASVENVKNSVFFSGGTVSGSNIYTSNSDGASIAKYGVKLDRQSDNRVTTLTTAQTIASGNVAKSKDEQYATTVTVMGNTMDITLLKPGKVIGFNGFGTFIDNLTAQIVRVEYHPHYVTLTLGVLPKRLTPEFEKITRGLVAQQTVANPSSPS